MWKQLSRLNKISLSLSRTFLSKAYGCNEIWNARLNTPILQKVNLDTFYYDLEQKFQQQGKTTAIDIDIYANKVIDDNHFDELADLVHKLRMTEEASNALDSTSHAFIRNYIDYGQTEMMIQILKDPLNYGIFLNTFTANMALDRLIESKNFKSAAQIASLLMLQEDFGNDITKFLIIHACLQYLKNPEPFEEEIVPVKEEPKKSKKDEIRVRVKYLRNEYFDDHFDLKNHNHLVGKTLMLLGKEMNSSIGNSIQLLGLTLYGKYSQGVEFTEKLNTTGANKIYKDVLDQIKNILSMTESLEDETFKNFSLKIESLHNSSDKLILQNFEEDILKSLTDAVKKLEPLDVEQQKKLYESWCELRQQKLDEELDRLKRAQKLKEIERISKEMESEEQKLWFFENEEKIDLQIESKRVTYPKRWFGKKKKPRNVDEGYIPPEIGANRNKI